MPNTPQSTHERAAEVFSRRVRERHSGAVDMVMLFGSAARGEARGKDSDVDLLVIVCDGDEDVEDDVRDLAYDLELEYGVPFSLVVKTESEYERQRSRPFLRTVEGDANVLYG